MSQRILVWDVPTRVFHWLLALSFFGAFLTAESERYRDIHVVLGYTLLGLLVFRLVWGFLGTRYAQFRSFMFKPGEIIGYLLSLLKGKAQHYTGHNPAGSVAIWLLLGLGLTAGLSGVLLFEDIGGDILEELHELLANAMLLIVFVHVAGVLLSSVMHGENLVRSMITGYKSGETNDGIRHSHLWLGAIILAAVLAFWIDYPATGLVSPDAVAAHAEHNHDE